MPLEGPKPTFFWDPATQSKRPAEVDEPGDLVWNSSTQSWQPGTIGGDWKWNASTQSWEPGPGGEYIWNASTQTWAPASSSGYGGDSYWDGTTWVPNQGVGGAADDFLMETGDHLLQETNFSILLDYANILTEASDTLVTEAGAMLRVD